MKTFKIETFIPSTHTDQVIDALNDVGALTIGGNYDYCVFRTTGLGSWRPLEKSKPFLGKKGKMSKEEEIKIEFTCLEDKVSKAVHAIENNHPYEEVVINIFPVLTPGDFTGD